MPAPPNRPPPPKPAGVEGGERDVPPDAPPPAAPGMVTEGDSAPRDRDRDGGMIGEG